MDFAEKTPMVKNTVVGVERAISQIFIRGGGGGLETEKAFLCLGVVYLFFPRGWSLSIPLYQWGGGWVCWKGLGGYDGGMFSGTVVVLFI